MSSNPTFEKWYFRICLIIIFKNYFCSQQQFKKTRTIPKILMEYFHEIPPTCPLYLLTLLTIREVYDKISNLRQLNVFSQILKRSEEKNQRLTKSTHASLVGTW